MVPQPLAQPRDRQARPGRADAQGMAAFTQQFRQEMATPENRHTIALLAALSQHNNFSVGCYCEDEARCHRSVLRALLSEAGARIAD